MNGKRPYDILLEECDPNVLKMELDLCWITVAGQDPRDYFKRFPGRFPLVHVKDMKRIPSPAAAAAITVENDFYPDMADVGSGVIDWKRIFAKSDEAGIRHYLIEHDDPKSPFDSIRVSYNYVQRLRFYFRRLLKDLFVRNPSSEHRVRKIGTGCSLTAQPGHTRKKC